ncbi:cystathionine beta-lyase [Mesorhizobium sp. J428]|uniref:cystathionine beta-lyase n=1 Tax=Mesorhizobium sp. J428 TaxID=2898440 RepID=UPI002151DD45|nr:cystathionine beta-lyase [Mesorhizobium sp. J428]MCR5856440.1 cystathionine beta-lyase [Mesorhizobium sp. J428]
MSGKTSGGPGTLLVSAGHAHGVSGSSVNPPVHRASTFLFDTLAAFETASRTPFDGPFYGRVGTPTTFAFEQAIAELEGGHRSIATSSGVAAISAVFLAFLDKGDHVLVVDTVYDPVRRFCGRMLSRLGIETTFYHPAMGAEIETLIRPQTRLIYMESPGSGTFDMQDVAAIVAVAKARGLRTAIDATWATPLFMKPLALGVDVSIHAATKYIVGHSDAMLGVLTANAETYDAVRRSTQDLGACAGSEECNLGLRGLRTLEVRLRHHEAAAIDIASWLEGRPQVARVLHPGLPSFPGHDIWKRQLSGSCGLFAVELVDSDPASVRSLVDGLRHFKIGFSWGGYESLILPMHPEKARQVARWDGKGALLRLHVGLETVSDLKADLAAGLERLRPL